MGCACIQQDVVVRNQRINKERGLSEQNSRRLSGNIQQRESPNNERHGVHNQPVESVNDNNPRYVPPRNTNNRNSQQHSHIDIPVRNNNRDTNIQSLHAMNSRMLLQGEIYLQSKFNPNFNYPEIEDVYLGLGLKRMKAYICPHSQEELLKKRTEFWGKLFRLTYRYSDRGESRNLADIGEGM
jgi:hypothetical protein